MMLDSTKWQSASMVALERLRLAQAIVKLGKICRGLREGKGVQASAACKSGNKKPGQDLRSYPGEIS